MPSDILVLGLGNILLSDEGAGVYVVQRLQGHGDAMAGLGLRPLDGGTLSFTLAGPIQEADGLIVVDTAALEAEAGAVRVFEGDAMDHFVATGKKSSVHEVGLVDLLAVARLEERLPPHRALVGIQPQWIDWGEELSPAVSAALGRACEAVEEVARRWQT